MAHWHAIAAAACALAGAALGASFDCARAATAAEKTICADAELGTLDEHLGRYYAAARDALGDGAPCLQSDQQDWLRRVRDACRDRDCLRAAYLDRLAELDALQPGVTAIRNISLPRRPALAWIVPPAADRVAAPPNSKAVPFTATGTLVNEIEGGDGYVLREDSGKRHLLVMLMFLGGPTQQALQGLAREPGARFTVRGYLAGNAAEPSRCLYIYRHAGGGIALREGRMLTDATAAYPGFKPYEMPFVLPTDGVARAEFRSEPFYAVILETFPPCFDIEPARLRVQAQFPKNKVFGTRFGCEGSGEERIDYTNVARDWGFMAIFAGTDKAQAEAFLEHVKKEGRFRSPNLRRMQAVLVYP